MTNGKFAPPMCAQSERDEIIIEFMKLLRDATADGNGKRVLGTKPLWKIDPSHETAIFSHLARWKSGEQRDPDSGAHPLVHLAWRALAIAWQEKHGVDRIGLTNGGKAHQAPLDAVGVQLINDTIVVGKTSAGATRGKIHFSLPAAH